MSNTAELHQTEWEMMWQALYAVAGSCDDENKESGERWQYMGTSGFGEVKHQFRHRDRSAPARPLLGHMTHTGRIYLEVYASEEFAEAYKGGLVRNVEYHPFKVLG